MSVNLITGNLFSPIQASQDSDYQAGTFGEKTQILNVGSKMEVSIVDNSTIRCEDGVLVTREGRRVQIDNGDVVEWTIPTGTQGTTSYYIVGFRLYTDSESAQLCDTFVQLVSGPGATITEDTFRDGAVEIFVSVARVVQNGITLESVESLVPVATTLDQAKKDISRINSDVAEIYKVSDRVSDETYTNLLNPTAKTTTINGVTFTNNGDGTYTANGTASGEVLFVFRTAIDTLDTPKIYRLVGCPEGGTSSTYELNIIKIVGSSRSVIAIDTGNGKTVELVSGATYEVRTKITNGTTCNNLLFKPMITTDLSATYDDFIPYSGSGALNENVQKIYSDLMPNYFQLSSSSPVVTIEQQDNWRQGNRIHIAFSATSSADMPRENAWAIVPNEHRGRGTRTCGFVHIDGIPDMRINSIMVDGVESGYIYQRLNSSVPANTRVTFIGDYFLFN